MERKSSKLAIFYRIIDSGSLDQLFFFGIVKVDISSIGIKFEDFLSNFPYPASYLASAHKDSSDGASENKKKLSPMVVMECIDYYEL